MKTYLMADIYLKGFSPHPSSTSKSAQSIHLNLIKRPVLTDPLCWFICVNNSFLARPVILLRLKAMLDASFLVVTLMRDVIHSQLFSIDAVTVTCNYFCHYKNGNELYQYNMIHTREVPLLAHKKE